MPKQRITKEMVVNTAFEFARHNEMERILVKNIAKELGCSVQPIQCLFHIIVFYVGIRPFVLKKGKSYMGIRER